MMHTSFKILSFLGLLFNWTTTAQAQIPVGQWRDHLPYTHAFRIEAAEGIVFCATNGGGLFAYDPRDSKLTKYSKVNGLSDADITAISYSSTTKTLLVGYRNGNLDLIKEDSIFNIPDIRRKIILGDKAIAGVMCMDHLAYLACGFGIVAVDLVKREIKDTYQFGPGGSQIQVHAIAGNTQTLFAATASGIYQASLSHPNLVDFSAWSKITNLPNPDASYSFLAWYNNHLLTIWGGTSQEIISVGESGWNTWTGSVTGNYNSFAGKDGLLLFSLDDRYWVYGAEGEMIRKGSSYYAKDLIIDQRKDVWYANPDAGLVQITADNQEIVFAPDGPAFRDAGDITIKNGQVWIGGGTEGTKWAGYGAYAFIGEKWRNFNRLTVPELNNFLNISEIAIDPLNPEHVICGSYGYGVAEFRNGSLTDIEDETDGVLKPIAGFGQGYIRVTGVDFDAGGTAWLCTSNSEQGIYRLRPGNSWEYFPLDYSGFGFNTLVSGLLAHSSEQKWVLIQNLGLLVFSEIGEGETAENFFSIQNQRGDLLDRCYAIEEDTEGNVWVGTNKGLVVYYNPDDALEEDRPLAYQPEIPRKDGTSFIDLLLSTEKVNDIAIDGGNRKWVATEKSGVYLLSPDGKEEIRHFTESNSPLFADNVLSVAVNDISGEVFFGTEKGIVSFRGEATGGTADFGNVYVFPNPVRENFRGPITVTGLAANVNVKVTDISGNLMYETTALGGQAVWDGTNFRGERVQTGVYLVFCTNEDGSKTHVTKLLLIH